MLPPKKWFPTLSMAVMGFTLILFMILYPEESLEAGLKGVNIWWDVLFPSLLPFLVISELMLGFGIVHFFGTLLDPMMRPLFRVPGIGGFILTMGFASGYPVSARLTAQLWERKLISRSEGERLVSFATSSDPIFLIGAVAVGFFRDATLAPILIITHYGASLLVGLIMRFVGKDRPAAETGTDQEAQHKKTQHKEGRHFAQPFILIRALKSMHQARLADGRPIGVILGQAVANSLPLIFVIGGLVVFFSVMIEMMTLARLIPVLQAAIQLLFQWLSLPPALSQAVVNGIFEVTLGAKSAGAGDAGIPLVSKTAIAALVLSWGGLSVHAQIISILQNTGFRYLPFLFARIIHSILSCTLVFLLWEPLASLRASSAVFLPEIDPSRPWSVYSGLFVTTVGTVTASLICVTALYLIYAVWKRLGAALRFKG